MRYLLNPLSLCGHIPTLYILPFFLCCTLSTIAKPISNPLPLNPSSDSLDLLIPIHAPLLPSSSLHPRVGAIPNPTTSPTPLLPKRGTITHYNNLGVWRMALTASSIFYSSTTPNHLQPAASTIATFLAEVVSQAHQNSVQSLAESAIVEFGLGAISLAFRIRNGVGSSVTVPWSLVSRLAEEFQSRAEMGNPTSFRAVVQGPLGGGGGGSSLGLEPWIEVVMVVAGEKVMDGFPWSIY